MLSTFLQVLTLLEEAKNGRVGVCNPPSMPVPSSPLSPQSATALFAISIVRPPTSVFTSCHFDGDNTELWRCYKPWHAIPAFTELARDAPIVLPS